MRRLARSSPRHVCTTADVHVFFIAVDIVLAVLAVRSALLLRRRAPWTSAGWIGTCGYCIAAAIEFSSAALQHAASIVAYVLLVVLAVTFAIAGVRDEPQAEPWWWPSRIGLTNCAPPDPRTRRR